MPPQQSSTFAQNQGHLAVAVILAFLADPSVCLDILQRETISESIGASETRRQLELLCYKEVKEQAAREAREASRPFNGSNYRNAKQ